MPSSEAEQTRSRPSTLACRECRSRHLKCDAKVPVCSRCANSDRVCTYIKSRRGRRSSRSSSHLENEATSSIHIPPEHYRPGQSGSDMAVHTRSFPVPASSGSQFSTPSRSSEQEQSSVSHLADNIVPLQPNLPRPSRFSNTPDVPQSINLYYSQFHPSHPILLPQSRYQLQSYPLYLQLTVQFIGSHFEADPLEPVRQDAVDAALSSASGERSITLVQSLLLFAIALHARTERAAAVQTLAKASDLAIELGMNREDFAVAHGLQDPLLEESIRRTWWELYVVDGLFAAFHLQQGFRCDGVELAATLPCEEICFAKEMQSQPTMTLKDFDQRFFLDNGPTFSSATYRVGAVRILARILTLMDAPDADAEKVKAADNAITTWKLHLPLDKDALADQSGSLDQMMFQAHIIMNCASIFLHFPKSKLFHMLPTAGSIPCLERVASTSSTSHLHTLKAISASTQLSELVAISAEKQTPFLCCIVAFGCVVQLAACSAHFESDPAQCRDRVALMTGVLKHSARAWVMSRCILQRINQIARQVLNIHAPSASATGRDSSDSGVDLALGEDNLNWLDFLLFGSGDNLTATSDSIFLAEPPVIV